MTSFYDNFEELNFGGNFLFHVISLSVSCNLFKCNAIAHIVGVYCTGKIQGSQDRTFLFRGGPVNYEELERML
jgi:hypothetical protein